MNNTNAHSHTHTHTQKHVTKLQIPTNQKAVLSSVVPTAAIENTHAHTHTHTHAHAHTHTQPQGKSALELLKQKQSARPVFTMCQAIDRMLGGGVAIGEVTEFCMCVCVCVFGVFKLYF